MNCYAVVIAGFNELNQSTNQLINKPINWTYLTSGVPALVLALGARVTDGVVRSLSTSDVLARRGAAAASTVTYCTADVASRDALGGGIILLISETAGMTTGYSI